MPKNDHKPLRSRFKKPIFVVLNVVLTATFRFDIAKFCSPKCSPKCSPNAKNHVFQDYVKIQKYNQGSGKFPVTPVELYSIFGNCF